MYVYEVWPDVQEKTFIGPLSNGAAMATEATMAAIAAIENVSLTIVPMDELA